MPPPAPRLRPWSPPTLEGPMQVAGAHGELGLSVVLSISEALRAGRSSVAVWHGRQRELALKDRLGLHS